MADYIERDIMLAKFIEGDGDDDFTIGYNFAVNEYRDKLKAIPSINIEPVTDIEMQPVKRGRWFHINNDGIVYCSECNNEAYWDTDYGQQLFDYCPYCGAKMIKDGDTNG